MNVFDKIYNDLIDSTSLYHDVILLGDDDKKIYTSKYFLRHISPVLEKILEYDKKDDNIYHFPHKKSDIIRIVIALSFPFIDINEILKYQDKNVNPDFYQVTITPEVMRLIDEWCMTELYDKIESFYLQKYDKYKIDEILFFCYKCKFPKVIDKIMNNMTIKKHDLIKDAKSWSKYDDTFKISITESVIQNIKKRKCNYYD